MRVTNKISYHRRKESADDEGCLNGVAAVVAEMAAVVAAAVRATMNPAVGSVARMVASAVVVAVVAVVVTGKVEVVEEAVIIINNRT